MLTLGFFIPRCGNSLSGHFRISLVTLPCTCEKPVWHLHYISGMPITHVQHRVKNLLSTPTSHFMKTEKFSSLLIVRFHFCGKISYKNNLRKEALIWVCGLRGYCPSWRESRGGLSQQLATWHPQSGVRQRWTLVLSLLLLFKILFIQSMTLAYRMVPTVRTDPQLTLPTNSPTDPHRTVSWGHLKQADLMAN